MPMTLNPFSAATDYPSMLRKIAAYHFAIATFVVLFLWWQVPELAKAADRVPFTVEVRGNKFPFIVILVSLLTAFISRTIKFHDRLSDLFGIRQGFDVHSILIPMALAVGVQVSVPKIKSMFEKRKELMAKTFYAYASSGPEKAVIDRHYITIALDQWSWYWIVLEGTGLLLVGSVVLAVFGKFAAAYVLGGAAVLGFWLLSAIRSQCARYALQQVELIVDDSERCAAIARHFGAI